MVLDEHVITVEVMIIIFFFNYHRFKKFLILVKEIVLKRTPKFH